jgi:hypothetical protein
MAAVAGDVPVRTEVIAKAKPPTRERRGLEKDRPLTVKLVKMTARMLKREERWEREYHEQPR